MRGHTIQQVADDMNMNYKTLSGILNRNEVKAELLLRLANLLDIDLCWMAQLYEGRRPISFLEQYQMCRMNPDMREEELKIILPNLDRHIVENPTNINDVKKCLLKDYNQLFYLLDVLLPESYIIRIVVERDREKYYCMPLDSNIQNNNLSRGRRSTTQFYEGHEMLKQIILERKARLKI